MNINSRYYMAIRINLFICVFDRVYILIEDVYEEVFYKLFDCNQTLRSLLFDLKKKNNYYQYFYVRVRGATMTPELYNKYIRYGRESIII